MKKDLIKEVLTYLEESVDYLQNFGAVPNTLFKALNLLREEQSKKEEIERAWEEYEFKVHEDNMDFLESIEYSFYLDMKERYWGRYYSPNEDDECVYQDCEKLWEEHEAQNPIYDDEWMWDDCLAWMAGTKPIRDKAEWDAVHDEMPVCFEGKYSRAPELFKDPSRHWRAVLLLYKYYYACVNKFIVRWDDTYDPLPF